MTDGNTTATQEEKSPPENPNEADSQQQSGIVAGKDATGESGKDIQKQAEAHDSDQPRKYGTFAGVFTPTLLTILGVILFLREGWVIGNAGLGGAWVIIALSFCIAGATGLSMSSFVTNIRVGPGGAFSMISQSLGLEVGGAVGLPLYLSQALAVVMYIFGFRAGWQWASQAMGFPDVPAIAIDLTVFALITGITLISTRLAFRAQYLILATIILALLSVAAAAVTIPMDKTVVWWGSYPGSLESDFSGTHFWAVFAVFFPASTGIMAGANMSGELKNPRKSIPVGTMAAIGLSFIVYMAVAYWLARSVSMDELTRNYTVMIDKAFYGPVVLAGLLAATFSSALASFVGAPRILQALGSHNIVPAGAFCARRSRKGEPINAMIVTAAIVLAAIMLRELNAVAPLITMIFLLTYATINLVVSIEQNLRLISYRPLFAVNRLIPLTGLCGCLLAMFIINPVFGLVAMVLVVVLYFILMRRRLTSPYGDVRSGLFSAVAEWGAKQVSLSRGNNQRAWKPNILMPTHDPRRLRGAFKLVSHLAYPMGSLKLMGVAASRKYSDVLVKRLEDSRQAFINEGVFTSSTVIEADDFPNAVKVGLQAMGGSFFRPNLLFMDLPKDPATHEAIADLVDEAKRQRMGAAVLVLHEDSGLGRRQKVNLWLPDRGPKWELEMEFGNLDLAILLAYRMLDSWRNAELTVIGVVENPNHRERAGKFLDRLVDLARLPSQTAVHVADGDFGRFASKAPRADLNVFPLPKTFDAGFLFSIKDATGASCLFTQDSGDESALA
ncbi:MAG TPA: Na-K-Cl cotransporter [Desulfobacteraceae bacterium]|nr:Na-K-Cl cotransporter [Desulfobacteraceae bacterium]